MNKNLLYGGVALTVLIVVVAVFMMMKKESFTWSTGSAPNITVGTAGSVYNSVTGGSAPYPQNGSLMLESDPQGNLSTSASLPIGAIVLWYGPKTSIPVGWILCDGNNGTPDLSSNRLPLGTNADVNIGLSGGSQTVTLTSSNLPPHTHNIYLGGPANQTGYGSNVYSVNSSYIFGTNGATAEPINAGWYGDAGSSGDINWYGMPYATDSGTGLSTAVNIMNPYTAVYFIMKIQ